MLLLQFDEYEHLIDVSTHFAYFLFQKSIDYHLHEGVSLRVDGEIKKMMPRVSQRVLTAQLRELENDNIVKRTVFPEVPPRVEYEITSFGRSLKPILMAMADWGDKYSQHAEKINESET